MLATYHTQRSIDELLGMHRGRRLNLEPAFQRRSVWSVRDRQALILSVLDGIPLPTVYLYRQVGSRGVPKYDVIDGKQRIETLLMFLGKGPLARGEPLWVRTTFDEQPRDWWLWQHLSKDIRHRFLSTTIPTIEVDGELSEVIDLFIRINSTGMRLTGQERRHAAFYTTPVLRTAQRLADDNQAFFLRNGILTHSQVRRMKHVELSTELLLAVNADHPLNKKSSIDKVIANPISGLELRPAAASLQRAFRLAAAVLPDLRTTRFRNTTDFYTLVLLLHQLKAEGRRVSAHASARNRLAADLLRNFGLAVDEVNEHMRIGRGARSDEETFRSYLATVRADTDSYKQRMARERILREVLEHVFDDLDARRAFNATQRRIVWHASVDKECAFCRKTVASWTDMAVDHVRPYSAGGRTDLSNAALAHRSCNAKAGAKLR